MPDEARRILADHLWSSEPLTDWERDELVKAGLVTEDDLELLPGRDLTMDPRMYWRYVGTLWDVTLGPDGQPLLVLADEEAVGFDLVGFLTGMLEVHLSSHEPLREQDVRAIAAMGVAAADDFEDRGGGCYWHRSIPEE